MAVEIGALRAMLSLDSAAFEKGAKRAQASMNKMQRSLSKTSDRMRKIGRSMTTRVTAPIVAGIGLMGRSAVRNAVEIERLSQVANAGTTEFQRMAAGARDVGIEQDKLADILKDTNDRVGDFLSTGGGPMADFFENIAPKVGVTAEQFKNLSGPQALQLYVSSLEKAGVNQQEMTFYMEALASDATLLLPLLRDNGKEMDRLADMAEKAGMVMDKKTIKALARTDDALRAAGDAVRGLFVEIMMSLAPAMEAVAEKVGAAARWFSELSPEMKKLIGIGAAVAAAIGPLAIALGFVAAGLAALASPIGLVVLGFGAVVGVAAAVAANWDKLKERFPALTEGMKRLGEVFQVQWEFIKTLVVGAKDIVNGAIDAIVGVLTGDLQGALEGLKTMWQGWSDIVDGAVTAVLGILEAIFPGFDQAVQDILDAVKDLPGKIKQWGIETIQGFVDGIKEKWAELKESVLSIFRLDDAGQQAIEDGKKLGRDLSLGLSSGMRQNQSQLEADTRAYVEGVNQAGKEAAESNSPSKVWMRLGRDLMNGLSVGIGEKAQEAAGRAAQAVSGITDRAGQVMSEGAQKISGVFDQIGDGFAGAILQGRDFGESMRGIFAQIASDFVSSNISNFLGNLFGLGGGGGGGILSGLFAGFFDGGGRIPSGQFGIAGEYGPEIVKGPAHVTSRADTARMMQAQPARVEVVARVENGNIVQTIREVSGDVAVKTVRAGLQEYDRTQFAESFERVSNDPRGRM